MKKQRGSALIIAVFIISAIGSVAFGIGRLIYLQIASANAYEKGVHAYYAAESGIEEGFLRYRYDQGMDIPDTIDLVNENVYRNNLTKESSVTNGKDGIYPSLTPNNDITDQVYDLRINPWVKFYGDNVSGDTYGDKIKDSSYAEAKPEYQIVRDESKNFKVNLSGPNIYNLYFKPVPDTEGGSSLFDDFASQGKNCPLIEIKIIARKNPASPLEEHKKIFGNNTACDYDTVFSAGDAETHGDYFINGDGYARIDDIKTQVWFGQGAINNDAELSELSIKPIGQDIKFLLAPTIYTGMLGPNTKITSDGYYMGIRRGLEANIDRQSGSLYDLFDYVVYNAQ